MSARGQLRRLHDTLAHLAAAAVHGVPVLEQPFVAAGRHARSLRAVQVFYGRAAAELSRRWRQDAASYRPLSIAGQELQLDVAEFYAHEHFFHGRPFEPGLAACLARMLRPGDTFVDAGANHGYFSMLAARLVGPSGRVIAFEPHGEARDRLDRHLELNGLQGRVEVQAMALSDRSGTARMHQAHHSALASLVPDQSPVRHLVEFGAPFDVQTVRFDDWRAEHAPGPIRLMKIDVEGAELMVLSGMPAALGSGLDALVLETAPDSGADRLLRDAGYRVSTLDAYPDGPENRLYTPGPRRGV
jgi:FkbM family methyltransferase